MPEDHPTDDDDAAAADGADVKPAQEPLPMGSPTEVAAALANHNIAPDVPGGEFLYGPGLTIEIPMNNTTDEIMQIRCSMIDEDIAWPVLFRMCQQRDWSLMDPDSGRVLHISVDATT